MEQQTTLNNNNGIPSSQDILKNYEAIQKRMNQALSTNSAHQQVTLVGVTKTKPSQLVQTAYDLGYRHFGENYVDELIQKAQILPKDIKWHMIGHLQSNKAKKLVQAVPNLYMLETLSSQSLAKELNKRAQQQNVVLQVLVQINISNEASKSGVLLEECMDLVKFVIEKCPNLKFGGLMSMGELHDVSGFKKMEALRKEIGAQFGLEESSMQLSMGTSDDFEEAIQFGATEVRVGSVIFGKRSYPNKP